MIGIVSFNTVKLQQRKQSAACRRMASLTHTCIQLFNSNFSAITQRNRLAKLYCESILCLCHYKYIFKEKKGGKKTCVWQREVRCLLVVPGNYWPRCWFFLLLFGVCILHVMQIKWEHFTVSHVWISSCEMRNLKKSKSKSKKNNPCNSSSIFQNIPKLTKTSNLVSTISLTVNLLTVELLTEQIKSLTYTLFNNKRHYRSLFCFCQHKWGRCTLLKRLDQREVKILLALVSTHMSSGS